LELVDDGLFERCHQMRLLPALQPVWAFAFPPCGCEGRLKSAKDVVQSVERTVSFSILLAYPRLGDQRSILLCKHRAQCSTPLWRLLAGKMTLISFLWRGPSQRERSTKDCRKAVTQLVSDWSLALD